MLCLSQGYPQALLPLTVAGIPSIHICLDFIPELLAQPQLEKQVSSSLNPGVALGLCQSLSYTVVLFFKAILLGALSRVFAYNCVVYICYINF